MSPEQARGTSVDGRADLFSLGLVIYYCLTGEVLYRGETTYELLVKAATGPGPEELARIAALPGPCAAIVGKALEVNPDRRYQTAAEFAAALGPHTAGGAAAAAATVATLFADDFRAEEARFAAALPQAEGAAGRTARPTGPTCRVGDRERHAADRRPPPAGRPPLLIVQIGPPEPLDRGRGRLPNHPALPRARRAPRRDGHQRIDPVARAVFPGASGNAPDRRPPAGGRRPRDPRRRRPRSAARHRRPPSQRSAHRLRDQQPHLRARGLGRRAVRRRGSRRPQPAAPAGASSRLPAAGHRGARRPVRRAQPPPRDLPESALGRAGRSAPRAQAIAW